MKDKWIKAGSTAGFLGSIVFIFLTLFAAYNYPGYSIFINYLSDLGVGNNIFFNLGCIISGLSILLLANALYRKFPERIGKLGAVIFLLSGIFLIGVGVFTENSGLIHLLCAVIFFALAAVAIILLGIIMGRENKKMYFLSVIVVLCIAAFLPLGLTPLIEHIAVAAIILWTLCISYFIRK
ncbi:MAG: DUF998 domain-containing protein [Candidatus Aenigmarchaeota archaeon]|nr:DUF998 domain-containing protein [Candidatus Aenigmarchaeota archaeon]